MKETSDFGLTWSIQYCFELANVFFEIGIQDRILRNVVSQQKYQFPWWKFKENAMGQLVKINATVLFGWRSSPKRFSFSFPNWPPRLFTQVVNCASQIARKVVKLEIWEEEKTFCFYNDTVMIKNYFELEDSWCLARGGQL